MPAVPAASAAEAVVLGLIQGLTEFLPVSSSGHLVLAQSVMDVHGDDVFFDLLLHLGTLLPVLWFYRVDVRGVVVDPVRGQGPFWSRPGVRTALLVVLASIPTGIIGIALEDTFEALFANPGALSVTFLITASLLVSTAFARPATTDLSTMRPWQALVIGLAQGIAITPGISRSGTTIAVALLLGLKREDAARFSFLLSIPAILGALVLKADEASIGDLGFAAVGAGFLTSMVTGIFALTFLVGIVKRGGFPWFAPWCVLASATAAWVAWG